MESDNWIPLAFQNLVHIDNMKTGVKAALMGCMRVGVGTAIFYWQMIQIPLKEFTRYTFYLAILGDEICQNELDGNDR